MFPVRLRTTSLAALLLATVATLRVDAQDDKKPKLSEAIMAQVERMGETLRADHYSVRVRTIRVNGERQGEPIHIFHTMKILVDRPNKALIDVNGDDGANKIVFDGKAATLFSAAKNQYATIPIPQGTIQGMIDEMAGKLGVDMPLADLIGDSPTKDFLAGVESGQVINTVMIDGLPYVHLLFHQPPGIFLELWLAKDAPVVPRRLIVTYSQLPGAPRFIAEFSDWSFSGRPATSEFEFQVPQGATPIELKARPAEQK